jgi:uncharacterized protein
MSRSVWQFFALAYAFSWCAFLPMALSAQGLIPGLPGWLHLLGAFGPLLAGVVLTAWYGGRSGLGELLRRILHWRIGWGWLLAAWLSPALVFLIAVVVQGVLSASWSELSSFGLLEELPGVRGLAGWLVWTLTFGLGEETGWRGFALPRLQSSYPARTAALIVGLFWAGWHAPAFLYNYELSLMSVTVFLVGILSGSALLTWLYNSTGGSLLAVILWHGTYNAATAGASPLTAAAITAAVILAAIVAGRRYGLGSSANLPVQEME